MRRYGMRKILLGALLSTAACSAAPPGSKPFPRAQVVPQAADQVAFLVDGREVLRYHYGRSSPKPFFFPVIGPSGRTITRLTHPHDPVGHGHHLSLWIGHQSVDGVSFWEQPRGHARIEHDRILKLEDGDRAALTIRAKWLSDAATVSLLDERTWSLTPLEAGEFLLDLRMTLTPAAPRAVLGRTNFGMIAVRVAKTMGVKDGGGTITNSEGLVNEPQLMPHKRARWCDYSGPVAPGLINGITLIDHPANPGHPAHFHVRDDGWMGASLTFEAPIEIAREKPLVLRYRFWTHHGGCDPVRADAFSQSW
jgi:hypothetical protein